MRKRNSAIIIGSVRSKSNKAAFSISSAKDGGARASEVVKIGIRDLRVEEEKERIWGLVNLGSLGSETWGSFGLIAIVVIVVVEAAAAGIRALEEAMITLVMVAAATLCFVSDGVCGVRWF